MGDEEGANEIERAREALAEALLTDPCLGHARGTFYLVEYLPEDMVDAYLAAAPDALCEVVLCAYDEDHQDDLLDTYGDTDKVRILLDEEFDDNYARSGPFASVLAALLSTSDVAHLLGIDVANLNADDPRLQAAVTDAQLRRTISEGIRQASLLDDSDTYLESVNLIFPDFEIVVQFSAVPPLQDIGFCVVTPSPAG